MFRSSHGTIALGAIASAVASVALGAATLSGFGSSGGDTTVSPNPISTILLLLGVLVLIELEMAHRSRRRSPRRSRAAQAVHA